MLSVFTEEMKASLDGKEIRSIEELTGLSRDLAGQSISGPESTLGVNLDMRRGEYENLTGSGPPFGPGKTGVHEGIGQPENNGVITSEKKLLTLQCHKMSKDPNTWTTGREECSSRMLFVIK